MKLRLALTPQPSLLSFIRPAVPCSDSGSIGVDAAQNLCSIFTLGCLGDLLVVTENLFLFSTAFGPPLCGVGVLPR